MQVLTEAHGQPGLLHANGDLVFLEDFHEHHSRGQHVLVNGGAAPVQNAGLDRANVGPRVTEGGAHGDVSKHAVGKQK